MNIADMIVAGILLAIVVVVRYAWNHRKVGCTPVRRRLERRGERQGKAIAGEREWRGN